MATVLRSSLRPILAAIKAALVAGVPIPAERVLVSVRRKVPHFQADQDIVIRPRGFRIDASQTDHTGRFLTKIIRRIEFTCRTRLGFDETDRDESWLLDETYGHVALEERVIDVLQEFEATDEDGNGLQHGPMLLMDGPDPDKEADDDAGEWGYSTLVFELTYDLTFTEYPQ